MDAQLKAKWVAALRSGQFTQGRDYLYNPSKGSYCCLGVLCAINGISEDAISSQMTTDISRWLDSDLLSKEQRDHLGNKMNDAGVPFAEIADYIEKNL